MPEHNREIEGLQFVTFGWVSLYYSPHTGGQLP